MTDNSDDSMYERDDEPYLRTTKPAPWRSPDRKTDRERALSERIPALREALQKSKDAK